MERRPWIKFWKNDLLASVNFSALRWTEKGVYLNLVTIARDDEYAGQIVWPNGVPIPDDEICGILDSGARGRQGARRDKSREAIREAMAELERRGFIFKNASGAWEIRNYVEKTLDGAARGKAEIPFLPLPHSASPAAPPSPDEPTERSGNFTLSPPPSGESVDKKESEENFFENVREIWNSQARVKGWVVRTAPLDTSLKKAARSRAREFGGEAKFLEIFRAALAAFDAPWARGEGKDADGNSLARAKLVWALRPGKIQNLLDESVSPRQYEIKNKTYKIV